MKDKVQKAGSGGSVYGLGFIGAAFYFIGTATGFWMGMLGVLKLSSGQLFWCTKHCTASELRINEDEFLGKITLFGSTKYTLSL